MIFKGSFKPKPFHDYDFGMEQQSHLQLLGLINPQQTQTLTLQGADFSSLQWKVNRDGGLSALHREFFMPTIVGHEVFCSEGN